MNQLLLCVCLSVSLVFSTSIEDRSSFCARQILHYTRLQQRCLQALHHLDQKNDALRKQVAAFEIQKEQTGLYLLAEQMGVEASWDEEAFLRQAQSALADQAHREQIESVTKTYRSRLKKAEARKAYWIQVQETLFLDNPQLRGFRPGGMREAAQTLAGTEDLPVFGSIGVTKETGNSCLGLVDGSRIEASASFLAPFANASLSAGTWAYPQGGLHLGADYAVPMHTPLLAPAPGIVLYANAPVEEDGGFLGNWCGWPAGAGNSICLLCKVGDTFYVLTFSHLSRSLFVRAGQSVQQGDVLALSGNSGNSTGPHCHIEVFSLAADVDFVLQYFIESADFSLGNGWDAPATCSPYACRIQPETIF